MEITKEKVLKELEAVIYFPKADNIVNLNMVTDLEVTGKRISFSLVFPKLADNSIPLVTEACRKTLKAAAGDSYEITITPRAEKDAGRGPLSGVKNIIAVASGKGGVGKSTIAVNLAIALANKGFKVGLLDADIHGPSVPIMLDLEHEKPRATEKDGQTRILPIEKYGLHILSIGFFVKPEQALIWRGPMASRALEQLFNDSDWGELDYMVLDLPPGTGDIHLTLAQQYPVTGALVVTTPQKVAMADVQKAVSMFNQEKIHIPVIGLVENMSYFTPAELPDNKYFIFGKSSSEEYASKLGIPFLGQIPVVQGIAESGDSGIPVALNQNSPEGKAFSKLADNIIKGIKVSAMS